MLELLAGYLDTRAQQRAEAVRARLERLSHRERALVREAAVMGYVHGATFGPHRDKIPPDSAILAEVVEACIAHSDLYPSISGVPRD